MLSSFIDCISSNNVFVVVKCKKLSISFYVSKYLAKKELQVLKHGMPQIHVQPSSTELLCDMSPKFQSGHPR